MSMPMQRKRDQKILEKPSSAVIAEHHVHTWKGFLSEAKRSGLKLGFFENYSGKGLQKEGKHIMEEAVFFSIEKGIIIYAYTFSGKSANYAKLYGELLRKDAIMTEKQKNALTMFNHWQVKKDVIPFAMDVKQGMESQIQSLSKLFEFCSPWIAQQEIQFVNIIEKDGTDMSKRESITWDKLSRCDPKVREILGV